MYKSIVLNQYWAYLCILHVMLAMTLLSTNLETVSANAVTAEIPTASDNENDFIMAVDEREEYGDLSSPWSKRSVRDDGLNTDITPVMVFFESPAAMEDFASNENYDLNDGNILNQKRGWKKMNVAWGKRRNAGQYMNRDFAPSASAAGSWGKREPNWNNLKGMWGKRSSTTGLSHKRAGKGEQWNYLRGSWGKRSAQFSETN